MPEKLQRFFQTKDTGATQELMEMPRDSQVIPPQIKMKNTSTRNAVNVVVTTAIIEAVDQ